MRKERKTTMITAAVLLACSLFFTGCGTKASSGNSSRTEEKSVTTGAAIGSEKQEDSSTEDPYVIRAMYLTDPSGNIYFVDINYGTFFTAPIPDELYNNSGEKISAGALSAGYVLDIYGNGMMLESYPGQYPGVTKMAVVKEGTAEDAKQYQDLIDSVYVEPDYSEPPYVNAEYKTDLAAICAMLTRGSYEWSYLDANGQMQHVVACSSHILEWPILADLTVENGTELTLLCSYKPQSISVTRWPDSLRSSDSPADTDDSAADATSLGEAVEVSEKGEDHLISVEPGYVYLLEVSWEEGTVEYGFYTK